MYDNALQAKRYVLGIGTTALLIIFGLTQALSLAWPFSDSFQGQSQGWLQCVSLAVLAGLLDRSQSLKQAFVKGWLFSLVWLIGSTWWLFISMNTYGGLSVPIAALAVVALAAGLALFYGLACAVFHVICKTNLGVLARACTFAAVWVLAEMVRGTIWSGFPWGAVGYAHVDSLLQHWAPWGGVYGLCALSAFLAMAVAAKRRVKRATSLTTRIAGTLGVLVLSLTWITSPSRNAADQHLSVNPLRVTLLQGNIPQDLKFGAGVQRALHDYQEALLQSDGDLTVTPETALPLLPSQLPEHYLQRLTDHFATGEKAALMGLPLATPNAQGRLQYSNSAVALMPQVTLSTTSSNISVTRALPPPTPIAYQYDKHHLVPFGEFVPPMFQWFVRLMNIPLGEFTRGALAQPSLQFRGERIAPNICYEDLFGEELGRSFANPATAPTLMVNLSNIAWFGDTVAIDQHLNISRMRALEFGRPMLRATNTGATAVINAQGQVTHRLPSAVKGVLTAEVYGVHGPITPYARWVSVWGLWPLVGLAVLVLLVVAGTTRASRFKPRLGKMLG